MTTVRVSDKTLQFLNVHKAINNFKSQDENILSLIPESTKRKCRPKNS